ncbi:MAG TPA: hypothetical protein VFI17_09885 [Solirubrobacterales bacterium]|nr:hypothetical protein [Solirubrobacterales bacterium]
MHDKPIGAAAEGRATTIAEDEHDQAAVLAHLLLLHPAHLTAAELIRELTGGSADFESEDRFSRAIRDLCGVGLVHNNGDLVLPTRAALAFDELLHD